MNKIFLTGDTHIPTDIHKLNSFNFAEGKTLTKNDYVIVLGDFGLLWEVNTTSEENFWKNWLNNKPWTTLFIDGNHENFHRLNNLNTTNMFGGKVGIVSDSIYHLKRGEIYTINNKTFFCMGGASSHDKQHRKEFISWWKEEVPNNKEFENGLNNLDKVNWNIDCILSHDGPSFISKSLYNNFTSVEARLNSPLLDFFDVLYEKCSFKEWYCGHHHVDKKIKKVNILFDTVKKLKE